MERLARAMSRAPLVRAVWQARWVPPEQQATEGIQETPVEAVPALLDRRGGVPEPVAALVERAEVVLEQVKATVERVPRELQAQAARAAHVVGPTSLVARRTPAAVAAVASAGPAPRAGPHARLVEWGPGCA